MQKEVHNVLYVTPGMLKFAQEGQTLLCKFSQGITCAFVTISISDDISLHLCNFLPTFAVRNQSMLTVHLLPIH